MPPRRFVPALLVLALLVGRRALGGELGVQPALQRLPAEWLSRWERPPLADRPLQIVHGIPAGRATVEGMQFYKDRGLGGVACNVAFDHYLRSEENWRTLVAGVEACGKLGMVVWFYDEEGYPAARPAAWCWRRTRPSRPPSWPWTPRATIRLRSGGPTNTPTPRTISTPPGDTPTWSTTGPPARSSPRPTSG
jgi:hypothetical protein